MKGIAVVVFLIFSSSVIAQDRDLNKYRRDSTRYARDSHSTIERWKESAGAVNPAYANRANELAAAAKKNVAMRQNKEYKSIVRDGMEIFKDSKGMFSSIREWDSDNAIVKAALCRADNGKATLLNAAGKIINLKIESLDEDSKAYVDDWILFEKLGRKRRAEFVLVQPLLDKIVELEDINTKLHEEIEELKSTVTTAPELANKPIGKETRPNKKLPFEYKNISWDRSTGLVTFIGEVTNNSGKDYTAASFTLSVYYSSDRLVASGAIIVNNLNDNQTKTFNGIIDRELPAGNLKPKIQFDTGF